MNVDPRDLVTPPQDDVIKDESNPHSVISLSPSSLQTYIRAIPDEVFELSIEELEKKAQIKESERKLRIAFWIEYERAKRVNAKILNLANIYRGIQHPNEFFRKTITNSFRLAYICTPPENYQIKMEEMLDFALSEERKILALPVEYVQTMYTKQGDPYEITVYDSKMAAVKHKIRESLQNRLQGMPVHRSMQITEQIHRNGDYGGASTITGGGIDLNALDNDGLKKYIAQLRGEEGSSQTIDVSLPERDITPVGERDK